MRDFLSRTRSNELAMACLFRGCLPYAASILAQFFRYQMHRFWRYIASETTDFIEIDRNYPIANGSTAPGQFCDRVNSRVPRQWDTIVWRRIGECSAHRHNNQLAASGDFFVSYHYNCGSELGIAMTILNPRVYNTTITNGRGGGQLGSIFHRDAR